MADIDPPRRMACVACTKSKRRCTKQLPACHRCVRNDLACAYPPPKITVPLDFNFPEGASLDLDDIMPFNAHSTCASQPQAVVRPLQHAWFLNPESWMIDSGPSPPPTTSPESSFWDGALRHFVDQVQGWRRQWVSKGSCPFIHAQLYQETGMPTCLKAAFASTAAYGTKTPATETIVLDVVDESAKMLLAANGDGDLCLTQHLSRTQALLMYEIIRLFDGDIRSRAQAEVDLNTLMDWAQDLWDKTQGQPSVELLNGQGSLKPAEIYRSDVQAVWRAWYISESIRRTYLVAKFIRGIFLTFKEGCAPCPGGILFSPRKGLWEATSPYTWAECLATDHLSAVGSTSLSNLFVCARPADVDEFTLAVLVASEGMEKCERWAHEPAFLEPFPIST